MTNTKQLFTSFVFCLITFISNSQPIEIPDFFERYLQSKVGYIHTTEGEVDLLVYVNMDIQFDIPTLVNGLTKHDIEVKNINARLNRLTVKADVSKLFSIASFTKVRWIEEVLELEANGNLIPAMHNITLAQDFGYMGKLMKIGVFEASGISGHFDLLKRVENKTAISTGTKENHALAVAGILAGNGNIDISYLGVLPKANLVIRSYQNDVLAEIEAAILEDTIGVTQNSYSITPTADPCGIRGSYKGISQDIDKLTNDYPFLVNVFSAGNGQTDCGNGYRTIPSGYQSAKNVITVGAIDIENKVTDESAFGPTRDGRIKPEVVALGEGSISLAPNDEYVTGLKGTSYAAPIVSGVSAMVVQKYQQQYGGALPPASLVRAAICNTADDLGAYGPDFKYGFGKVNALKAVDCIWKYRFFVDSVAHQGQKVHLVNVGNNVKELKVTIAWTDVEGNPANAVALINDIDMGILDPNNNGYLPWVLDTTGGNKGLPAVRGNDHINNIEQITIVDPDSGIHSILVLGENITAGYQTYSISFEIIKEEDVKLSYPTNRQNFIPGTTEKIWWNAASTSVFKLEYSLDDGNSWTVIADNISKDVRNYDWQVPDTFSEEAWIRITQGSSSDLAGDLFIMDYPDSIRVIPCKDEINVYWNGVKGSSYYYIWVLRDSTYMDASIGTNGNGGLNKTIGPLLVDKPYWIAVGNRDFADYKGRRSKPIKVFVDTSSVRDEIHIEDTSRVLCKSENVLKPIHVDKFGGINYSIYLETNNGNGWASSSFPLTPNQQGKYFLQRVVSENISYRLRYKSACGDWVYSPIVSYIMDSSHADFSYEYLGDEEYRFTPDYQDTGSSYFWSFGDGGSSENMIPTYKYFAPSTYKVKLTVISANGCEHKDSFTFVGTDKIDITSLRFYPNPANTFVDIQLEGGFDGEVTLSMYNILGKQVDNIEIVKLNNEICRINTATLPEGVYVVKLLINNKIYTNKLIIER